MQLRTSLVSAIALGVVVPAFAAPNPAPPAPSYGAVETLTWTKTAIGPEASPVSGDFTTGKHVTYLRFPGKFRTPVHTHTADYVGIVLAGTARHFVIKDEKTAPLLHAGSFWRMPANVNHVSECVSAEPCVFALIQDAKFDFLPTK